MVSQTQRYSDRLHPSIAFCKHAKEQAAIMPKIECQPSFTDRLEAPLGSRREFLAKIGKGASLASFGIFGAGCDAADRGLLSRGLLPVVLENAQEAGLPKPDMLVHSENPFNGEFAPHLLNDDVTPTERHFVRNNSGIPERAVTKDLRGWRLLSQRISVSNGKRLS